MKIYTPSLWERGVNGALIAARNIAEAPMAGRVATVQPSTSNFNRYPFLGEAPIMKLLKDELEAAGLSEASYTLTNKTYAISLAIGRDDLHDDQLDAQMQRAMEMSRVALNFANRLLTTCLINGTSVAGYDGVSYFNDAHPIRGAQTATQDNLLAGTGATVAALKADLISAIAVLMRWKAENDEPLTGSRSMFEMHIPVDLFGAANEAVYAAVIAQTSNEAFRGLRINVVANPRLTDVNDWYLLDVGPEGGPTKPLIYQEARPVNTEMLGPGSDHWVKHEEALIKCSWRGEAGYNHPGLAAKVVNS